VRREEEGRWGWVRMEKGIGEKEERERERKRES